MPHVVHIALVDDSHRANSACCFGLLDIKAVDCGKRGGRMNFPLLNPAELKRLAELAGL